ncbi:MAG: HAMP domain-containing protein, partial [Elusimicrobia bacterium]|nr:HAMP domain-containing protein [Elusimicrobiota bacterium]
MTAVSRGKLSYKLLGCFLGVSLGPMSYLGYKLVNLSQDALRKETQAMQESLAVGFADTVHKYVVTFKNVLSETAGVEEFRSMEPSRQTQTLNRVLQVHLALLELSVIKPDGSELVRVGRLLPANPPLRRLGDEDYVRKGLTGTYMGKLERFQGLYPAMTIAVPIIDRGGGRAAGVLAAKVSLNGLSSMLSMEFPATGKSVAYVASKEDGFLLAHSNLGAFKPNARVEEGLLRLLLSHEEKRGGGIMSLPDGRQVLGAYADVRQDLDWIVYVEQPLETAYLAAREMKAQTFKILIWVFLVVILLSLFVSLYITQPIRMLREAAYRLGQGQFDDLPEIRMTNDEIGELAQTFLSMSESLKEKTGELITAKQELEKFTKFLEKRVEARTRELKAAQDELIKKERLAAIGQMASVVGHEIRNPLAVINNSIYFIKTKLGAAIESDGKISKHIKIIESEIQ